MITPEQLVDRLLEQQTNVTVEYLPVTVDSMPHVTWMIRVEGAAPTQYIAKGTSHSLEIAKKEVADKIRLTGAVVTNVVDKVS
jgi:hypothetical protein